MRNSMKQTLIVLLFIFIHSSASDDSFHKLFVTPYKRMIGALEKKENVSYFFWEQLKKRCKDEPESAQSLSVIFGKKFDDIYFEEVLEEIWTAQTIKIDESKKADDRA